MSQRWVVGSTIRELRERKGLTQVGLASRIGVIDKTVSKWETGRGYPDITLVEPLARELGVSVAELLAGSVVTNSNVAANMLRSRFYVCPVCGNVMVSSGEAHVSCHGIVLPPLEAEPSEPSHCLRTSMIEGELYVESDHSMSKTHYLSFMAAVSPDRVQLRRLYPEGPAETRFTRAGVRELYYYCNQDGLFHMRLTR